MRDWTFHAQTLWLFTLSDLKTIVLPSTAFGLIHAISIAKLDGPATAPTSTVQISQLLARTPLVSFWAWINLLPFAIDNQRQPEAIQEDSLNKPWRAFPSGRLNTTCAMRIMLALYAVAITISLLVGPSSQSLLLVFLGYWYNDLHGADESCIVRNLINAAGFVCYTSGALQVALDDVGPVLDLTWWFTVIALVVFTSVQAQDMYDQEGDAFRGRNTVPLVIGDSASRFSIAIPVLFWSVACPWLWSTTTVGYFATIPLGLTTAFRTLKRRSIPSDKTTFRLWNLWLVFIYLLPLIKALEGRIPSFQLFKYLGKEVHGGCT